MSRFLIITAVLCFVGLATAIVQENGQSNAWCSSTTFCNTGYRCCSATTCCPNYTLCCPGGRTCCRRSNDLFGLPALTARNK
uniref:Cysteine rich secreted protein n=1 Tax=Riptortus pedestris TaxID=329032 RepID=R4WI02_RIPPE|nr:cysteine rich secreted protein [Riptortus pedestris]